MRRLNSTTRSWLSLCAAALFALPLPKTADAAVEFVFNYTDPAGVGWNAADPTGADRRAALEAAADIVEALFVNYTATIQLDVDGTETNDNTLAAVTSNFNGPFGPGFGNQGDVMIKILGGADPSAGADGIVNWNFEDFTWATGSAVGPGEYDLVSTAAHQLLQAAGFVSDISQNGNDPAGNTPGNPGFWAPFDRFVADSTGSIIDSTSFILDGARWNTASIGGTGTAPPTVGLYFNGPNATAANGGNPVPLYSPNPWEFGSSGSKLDDFFFSGANQLLMNSAADPGPGIRTVSAIEIGILKDIGYTDIVSARQPILTPGDSIIGGALDAAGLNFVVGTTGSTSGQNNWPPAEPPEDLIDGFIGGGGQKYLNFARENTGVIITPAASERGGSSLVTAMELWVANDAFPRDPASYRLYGTNTHICGTGPFPLSEFTMIASGDLSLPDTRDTTEDSVGFSQLVEFPNTAYYTTYLLIFPEVKDSPAANSMQLSELQFEGQTQPGYRTLIHYSLSESDEAGVATGVVPNLGDLGDGVTGAFGTNVSLSPDIPVTGVPAGAGDRSIDCAGVGGVNAPGTLHLSNAAIAEAGGFTMEAWFQFNGGGNVNSIIDYAGTEKLDRPSGAAGPRMQTNNAIIHTIGEAPAGEWHYVACVFRPTGPLNGDGTLTGDYTYYLDGIVPIRIEPGVTKDNFGDSLDRTIGVGMHPQGFGGDWFSGLIFEPRVTLTALESHQLLYAPPAVITDVQYDAGGGVLSVTWTSQTDQHYRIEGSNNLRDWSELTTCHGSSGPTTTAWLGGLGGELNYFVRVASD